MVVIRFGYFLSLQLCPTKTLLDAPTVLERAIGVESSGHSVHL